MIRDIRKYKHFIVNTDKAFLSWRPNILCKCLEKGGPIHPGCMWIGAKPCRKPYLPLSTDVELSIDETVFSSNKLPVKCKDISVSAHGDTLTYHLHDVYLTPKALLINVDSKMPCGQYHYPGHFSVKSNGKELFNVSMHMCYNSRLDNTL
jgi:hypothetical protein